MGIKDWLASIPLFAKSRRRLQPERETEAYARLQNLGVAYNQKAQIKVGPPNLRYFSRTPYARAAIRRIRDSIQRLEFEIKPDKNIKLNSELKKQIAICTECFMHPNNDLNWQEFIGQVVEDFLVAGAGTIEQQLGNDPIRPLWMWPVDTQSIQIFAGWAGGRNEARYIQTLGYSNVGFLEGRKLRNDEIVYIRANSSTESPYGFGSLEIAYNTINRQLGTAEFAGNLASNAQPQSLLFFKDADSEKLKAFRNYWRSEVEGQGITPMFGGKNEIECISLHTGNDSALYLEYQEYLLREIATAFGLSPMNMGVSKDVNRNTAEVEEDRDWDNAIVPPAELICSYLTREVLHAKLGYYQLVFTFKGLYREDEESTSAIYETYYKNNRTTPNMHRIEVGLPPMDNEWADMTYAETVMAQQAARGVKEIETPEAISDGKKTDSSKDKTKPKKSDRQSSDSFDNDD